MKIETPKKITWPEITVLLGSAASMDMLNNIYVVLFIKGKIVLSV